MRGKIAFLLPVLVALIGVVPTSAGAGSAATRVKIWTTATIPPKAKLGQRQVRMLRVQYRAHDGKQRRAYIVLPFWYGKQNNPPIPLVISPHGRGVSARANAKLWGALPHRGTFAVISPEGAGRALARYSWGSFGQIRDLAPDARDRTPHAAVAAGRQPPDLCVRRQHGRPGDAPPARPLSAAPRRRRGLRLGGRLRRQYRSFPAIPCDAVCQKTWHGPIGASLQSLARQETGGTPKTRPGAYAVRSPVTYVRSIAASCVPLQLWWSRSDRIVVNQHLQSGALFRRIKQLNPKAPVRAYVGYWAHSHEMQARTRLPLALAAFGLLPTHSRTLARGMNVVAEPDSTPRCGAKHRSAKARGKATKAPRGHR